MSNKPFSTTIEINASYTNTVADSSLTRRNTYVKTYLCTYKNKIYVLNFRVSSVLKKKYSDFSVSHL